MLTLVPAKFRKKLLSSPRRTCASDYKFRSKSCSNRLTSDTDLDGDFDASDLQRTSTQALAIAQDSNRLLGFTQTNSSHKLNAKGRGQQRDYAVHRTHDGQHWQITIKQDNTYGGKGPREIYRTGVQHETVDETLTVNGMSLTEKPVWRIVNCVLPERGGNTGMRHQDLPFLRRVVTLFRAPLRICSSMAS